MNIHVNQNILTLFKNNQKIGLNKDKEEDDRSQSMEERISRKIRAGHRLTVSEMDYLRRNNPEMYMRVKRIEMQREMLEKKLESCKSKEEVQEAYAQAVSHISQKDPDGEALTNAYHNALEEFKKSSKYHSLPLEAEEKEEEKKQKQHKNEESGFDLKA